MILMLSERLKELLSMSWNQREKIVLGLVSIKFIQPLEIDSGKKYTKWKKGVKII